MRACSRNALSLMWLRSPGPGSARDIGLDGFVVHLLAVDLSLHVAAKLVGLGQVGWRSYSLLATPR